MFKLKIKIDKNILSIQILEQPEWMRYKDGSDKKVLIQTTNFSIKSARFPELESNSFFIRGRSFTADNSIAKKYISSNFDKRVYLNKLKEALIKLEEKYEIQTN